MDRNEIVSDIIRGGTRAIMPLINHLDVVRQSDAILLLQFGNVRGGKTGLQTGQHLRRVGFENGFEPGENSRHRLADDGGHGWRDRIKKTPHPCLRPKAQRNHGDDGNGNADADFLPAVHFSGLMGFLSGSTAKILPSES
jgi:hypothetical protein